MTDTALAHQNTDGLTTADAEWFDLIAATKRAAAVGRDPVFAAQQIAEAEGVEALSASLRDPIARGSPKLHRGQGGETVPKLELDAPWKYRALSEVVTQKPTMLAADATLARLALARDADVLNMAVETAQDSGADTAVQKMLSHQLAAAHRLAMGLLTASANELHKHQVAAHVNPGALTEATRAANAGARLLAAFSQGAIALDRLQNGHHQTMTVQYVNVQDGGQAVIAGRVSPGNRVGEGRK